jgi:hypothetical protein
MPLIAEESCEKGFTSRVGAQHREARGVGYTEGYSSLYTFLSPSWDRWIPFVDGRLHIFNDGRFASNLGLGTRVAAFDGAWVFGANLYWDYRESKGLSTHQAGPGLEALSENVDVRLNGYIPFSGEEHNGPLKLAACTSTEAIIKQTSYFALPNINAEVGFPVPWNWARVVDLYFAVGPYYLFKEVGKISPARQIELGIIPQGKALTAGQSFGIRGRLTARLYDGLTLAIESTYDKTFHGTFQGYIAFSFPFGPGNMRTEGSRWRQAYTSPQCNSMAKKTRRMTQAVNRFEIIPVERKRQSLSSINDCETVAALLDFNADEIVDITPPPSPNSNDPVHIAEVTAQTQAAFTDWIKSYFFGGK